MPMTFRLLPVVVDTFIGTIAKPGAKFAFEKTFENINQHTHSTKWIQPNPRYSLFNHMGSERQSNTYRLC